MLCQYGQELRKIRIDHNESQRKMAGKLCVSATFLSLVEHGERRIPPGLTERIIAVYDLSGIQMETLRLAERRSAREVVLDMSDASNVKIDAALSVYRAFQLLPDDALKKICKICDRMIREDKN